MPIGTVNKVEGNYVFVTIERQDMCGSCHACQVLSNPKKCEIKCLNNKKCKVGDTVRISLDDSRFLKSTFIMYGIPLIFFFIGLAVGAEIAKFFGFSSEELCMIIGAVGMLVLSYLIIHRLDNKKKYEKMLPQIVEIIEE